MRVRVRLLAGERVIGQFWSSLAKTKIYHVVNLENVNITILLLFQHCLNLLHNIF